jgi:hypothetical protein
VWPVPGGQPCGDLLRLAAADPLVQPVPLYRAGYRFGVQDQAGELLAASFVIGGLVAVQAGAARDEAVLDVNRPAGSRSVTCCPQSGHPQASGESGRWPPASCPAAFWVPENSNSAPVSPGDPVDHAGHVVIGHDAAGHRHGAPPAAGRPSRGGQPDQLRVWYPGPAAEITGEFGQRLFHPRSPRPGSTRRRRRQDNGKKFPTAGRSDTAGR